MQTLIGSLFAIGVAGVAAIAATTAMLNTPHRIGPAAVTHRQRQRPAQDACGAGRSATRQRLRKAASPRRPARRPMPRSRATPRAPPAPAQGRRRRRQAEDDDKDPYEGIAPEELPPDLQYDADSSVSFPTNI